eukprot:1161141-Pelagomonas_calceolata.AAC.6
MQRRLKVDPFATPGARLFPRESWLKFCVSSTTGSYHPVSFAIPNVHDQFVRLTPENFFFKFV